MRAKFIRNVFENDNTVSFYFQPEADFSWIAGQYTEIHLPHDKVDSRGTQRLFTITNLSEDGFVSIATRTNGQASSYKRKLLNLQPGDMVTMSEPMGDFILPRDATIPLVFVAGGIGITPFVSIFRDLYAREQQRDIHFLYALHTEADIIFQDTYTKASIHTTVFVSEPSHEWSGERGRLTGDRVLKTSAPSPHALFYLSGPERMIETLQKELLSLGIEQRQIVTDFFHGYEPV